MKNIFKISIPKPKNRNLHAIDALTRKAQKFKLKSEKRKNNPNKQAWNDN